MGDKLINYFWIEIKGKNVKRLLNKIFKLKINISSIKYEKDRVLLKISYEDYKKIKPKRSIVFKIQKALYKILPKSLYAYIHRYSQYLYLYLNNKNVLK